MAKKETKTRNHMTDEEKVKRWHQYAKEHGWKGTEAVKMAETVAGGRIAALADWVRKHTKSAPKHKAKPKAHKPKAKAKAKKTA